MAKKKTEPCPFVRVELQYCLAMYRKRIRKLEKLQARIKRGELVTLEDIKNVDRMDGVPILWPDDTPLLH